ncbi:MAG: tRNA (cytidine(56)-2'-O)-methyltransferase [archaeon GW2011_AR20]|nr:MAG: tRNA (cytidine(56)-2'-O)-methyltransferase [archaeon GW2011_AR20]MBS3160079.1 tRNA (cytidine(56)-2'-O)-methyltransferase [Candidatus Woesearchaeota archaeon]
MIIVLRLNHRIFRDKRITSHVALTARAFLADKLYYSGEKDSNFEQSISKVCKQFGSKFEVEHCKDPVRFVKENKDKFTIVHLTCYGLNAQNQVNKLKNRNLIIIVGGEKVEPIYYKLAEYNLAVTKQPISEVSALAILLHLLNNGKELDNEFKDAKLKILESENSKKVVKG